MHDWLVVWLPFLSIFYFPICWVSNHPNWLSYFSEGWPNHQPDDLSPFLSFVEVNCHFRWSLVVVAPGIQYHSPSPGRRCHPGVFWSALASTKSAMETWGKNWGNFPKSEKWLIERVKPWNFRKKEISTPFSQSPTCVFQFFFFQQISHPSSSRLRSVDPVQIFVVDRCHLCLVHPEHNLNMSCLVHSSSNLEYYLGCALHILNEPYPADYRHNSLGCPTLWW